MGNFNLVVWKVPKNYIPPKLCHDVIVIMYVVCYFSHDGRIKWCRSSVLLERVFQQGLWRCPSVLLERVFQQGLWRCSSVC